MSLCPLMDNNSYVSSDGVEHTKSFFCGPWTSLEIAQIKREITETYIEICIKLQKEREGEIEPWKILETKRLKAITEPIAFKQEKEKVVKEIVKRMTKIRDECEKDTFIEMLKSRKGRVTRHI
jgi:hypothetical protein